MYFKSLLLFFLSTIYQNQVSTFTGEQNISLILIESICRQDINPFPNRPLFLHDCSISLLEKFPPFFLNSKLSSANSFSFEESKICHLGKVKSYLKYKIWFTIDRKHFGKRRKC